MFRTVPPVIRGCNASDLQAIVGEYGDPPHDDAEVSTANQGDDTDLPNDELLRGSLSATVRANHRHDDVVGAVPDEEDASQPNTDFMRLTQGVAPGDPLVFSHEYVNDCTFDPEDSAARALG